MKRTLILVAAATLFQFNLASGAEITMLATGATKEIVLDLVTQFEKTSGNKVVSTWTGTAGIKKRIADGEVYDLIIVGAPVVDAFIQQGKVLSVTLVCDHDHGGENLRRQEEEQRRRAAYEQASAERDALAAELKELYPVFADRIANLMARIEANDREIERINTHASPEGAARMRGAELVARGLGGFSSGVSDIPRITRDLRLPAFEYRTNDDYAWPRLKQLDRSLTSAAK